MHPILTQSLWSCLHLPRVSRSRASSAPEVGAHGPKQRGDPEAAERAALCRGTAAARPLPSAERDSWPRQCERSSGAGRGPGAGQTQPATCQQTARLPGRDLRAPAPYATPLHNDIRVWVEGPARESRRTARRRGERTPHFPRLTVAKKTRLKMQGFHHKFLSNIKDKVDNLSSKKD